VTVLLTSLLVVLLLVAGITWFVWAMWPEFGRDTGNEDDPTEGQEEPETLEPWSRG
jgi:regulatory protein YycH of two-component signal transduction system YycFG